MQYVTDDHKLEVLLRCCSLVTQDLNVEQRQALSLLTQKLLTDLQIQTKEENK